MIEGRAGEGRGRILLEVPGSGKSDAQQATDYRHPFYWTPFILMGNWL
jgi:CHAT domain-containing protein